MWQIQSHNILQDPHYLLIQLWAMVESKPKFKMVIGVSGWGEESVPEGLAKTWCSQYALGELCQGSWGCGL